MDTVEHNRLAWDHLVQEQNKWTQPFAASVIQKARMGEWSVLLTPDKAVPNEWFPPLKGVNVLGLAASGGQQGPIFAAAGAHVTILDNSPQQLQQDQKVATREELDIRLIQGDMADLSVFPDASFDLIFNPCSIVFVEDVLPVWKECFRVLKPGGDLLVGCANPVAYSLDPYAQKEGILKLKYALPYSDRTSITEEERIQLYGKNEPFAFGHTLQDLIGGQLDAGFQLIGFYEDTNQEDPEDLLQKLMPTYFATRARKPNENNSK